MRDGPTWFVLIELVGILSFAVNAMIVAHAKQLSSVAIFVVAACAAFGGGTMRDLLLGPPATPFFWVAHPTYIVIVFAVAMAYGLTPWFREIISRRIGVIKDAAEVVALASLAGIGTAKAYSILSAIGSAGWVGTAQLLILSAFLGSATSAAGSVIRDVLLNELPSTMKKGAGILEPLLLGCGLLATLLMLGMDKPWALLAGFAVTVGLRALNVWVRPARHPKAGQA